jgi:small metal-binding protein
MPRPPLTKGNGARADAVAGHAQQALEDAKKADNAQPDTHITEAETHLNQAIDHATMGHTDIAADHAQEAMRHLKMAYIHVYKRT